MTLRRSALAAVITIAAALAGALFLPGALTSRAVQNPTISIDMVTTGNSNTNTPQTHLFGATYNGGVEGDVNFAISPDTPAKSPADDTSYSTTGGGILAAITLQVVGAECNTGPMVFDLDDATPNPPGSKVVYFNGAGTQEILLAESALGDGTHTETGGTCPGGGTATPTATAAATPTRPATPTATAA